MNLTSAHTPGILVLMLLVSGAGGMAKGLTGFGGALVMAPLLSLMMPPAEASVLIVLVHCASSLQGVREWGPQTRWATIIPLALIAILSASLIAPWLPTGHADALRRIVGTGVLVTTVLHMRGWQWKHSGRWPSTVCAGILSGAMTACGGLGGPAAVYYLNGIARGATLRANLMGYFALLFCGVTLTMAASHLVMLPRLLLALPLTCAFATGGLLGGRLRHYLNAAVFDRVVCAMLLASGALALLA